MSETKILQPVPPKRSTSVARAYRNFFRPAPQASSSSSAEPSQPKKSFDFRRPKKSTEVQRGSSENKELYKQLAQCQQDLEEARRVADDQDKQITFLEQHAQSLDENFMKKQESLRQKKAELEDTLIEEIVERIKDAREAERREAEEGYKKQQEEYQAKIAELTNASRGATDGTAQRNVVVDAQIEPLKAELKVLKQNEAAHERVAKANTDLEVEVKSLKGELEQARVSLHNAEASFRDHIDRHSQLQATSDKALEDANQVIASVKGQLDRQTDSHKSEIAQLQTALGDVSKVREALLSDKDAATAELTTVKTQLEELATSQAEHAALSKSFEESEAKIAFLKRELEEASTREAALHESKTRLDEAQSQLLDYASCKEALQTAEGKLSELGQASESHQADKKALDEAQEKLDAMITKLEEHEKAAAELESEKARSAELLKDAEARALAVETAHSNLSEEVKALKDNASNGQIDSEELQNRLGALEETNFSLEAEIHTLKEAQKAADEKVNEADATRQKMIAEHDAFKAEAQAGSRILADELTELRAVKDAVEAHLQELEAELEAARTKLTDDNAIAEAMAADKDAQLAATKAESAELLQQLESSRGTDGASKDRLAAVEANRAELAASLETANSTLEEVKSQLAALSTDKANMSDELTGAQQKAQEATQQLEHATHAKTEIEEKLKQFLATQESSGTARIELEEQVNAHKLSNEGLANELAAVKSKQQEAESNARDMQELFVATKAALQEELEAAEAAKKAAEEALENVTAESAKALEQVHEKLAHAEARVLEADSQTASNAGQEAELRAANEAKADVELNLLRAEENLQASKDEHKKVQAQLEALQTELLELRSSQGAATEKHAKALDEALQRSQSSEVDLEAARTELDKLKQQMSQAQEHVAGVETLRAQVEEKDSEIEELKTWKAKTEHEMGELETSRAEIEELRQQLVQVKKDAAGVEDLKVHLATREGEIEELQTWKAKTEQEMASLMLSPAADKSFDREADGDAAQLDELRAQLAAKEDEVGDLQAWKKKTEDELAALTLSPALDKRFEKSEHEAHEELAELHKKLEERKKENEELRAWKKKTEEEIAGLYLSPPLDKSFASGPVIPQPASTENEDDDVESAVTATRGGAANGDGETQDMYGVAEPESPLSPMSALSPGEEAEEGELVGAGTGSVAGGAKVSQAQRRRQRRASRKSRA